MTTHGISTVQPCADEAPHPRHSWGWKKMCPGVGADDIPPEAVEAAAQSFWTANQQALLASGAIDAVVSWDDTPEFLKSRLRSCMVAALSAARREGL